MSTLKFSDLWQHHPYPDSPCDTKYFTNQCAIRMGVALRGAGINLGSFRGAVCYPNLKHSPRHVLRAQELANWLMTQTSFVGQVTIHKKVTSGDFIGRQGLVFINNGWGPTDHIDAWDGSALKGGAREYFALGEEVWFWELL